MNAKWVTVTVATALLLVSLPARAGDLGDPAPPLKVEKWIKGGPVDLKADQQHVYVIEFWATWCGPCRRSIPHLTELQKKYKDRGVLVIGVSIDEDQRRKTRDKVEEFVKEQGEKMDYLVALDDRDGSTEKAYLDGFKFDGIPTVFIIDRAGKVVWAGQAEEAADGGMSWKALDQALDEILAGKYDLAAAQKADEQRRQLAEKRAKAREQMGQYYDLVRRSEKKPPEADQLGKEVFAALGKDASLLNEFAWAILDDPTIAYRDLELALQVAKAAYDACDGKNAAIVDTYARALFDIGRTKQAVEYQKKAVELAGSNLELRTELEQTLKRYQDAVEKGP